MFSQSGQPVAFTIPLLIVGSFQPQNAPRVLLMGAVFGAVSAIPLLLSLGNAQRQEYSELEQPAERVLESRGQEPALCFPGWSSPAHLGSVDILQVTLLYFIKYGSSAKRQMT